MLATIRDLQPVTLAQYRDTRGVLVPVELLSAVPFNVSRLFWIYDVPAGGTRGSHAHKICQQYFLCVTGCVRVEAFDGSAECAIELKAGEGLHVLPAIFTTEFFVTPQSVLLVLCDRPFEPSDYLSDRDALAAYRLITRE